MAKASATPDDARHGVIVPLLIAVVIVMLLLPGIFNRIEEMSPTSDTANWFGQFKRDYSWLGLDALATLNPKKYGTGYWLGVAGASMLLLLLFYSAHKRIVKIRRLGSATGWMRIHVLFGALTPVLILYHCNFRLGALNSNVALWTMLTVALSGVVGRYFFTRSRKAFYQQQKSAHQLFEQIIGTQRHLTGSAPETEHLVAEMGAFDAKALAPRRSLLASIIKAFIFSLETRSKLRRFRSHSLALIDRQARAYSWPQNLRRAWRQNMGGQHDDYLAAIRRVARAGVYELSLGYWDLLHLPLSIIMVLAAIAHIVVVHTY